LRFSHPTFERCKSSLKLHIIPKWDKHALSVIKSVEIESWLRKVTRIDGKAASPGIKTKIRNLLSVDYVYGDEPTAGAPTRSTAQLPEVSAEALAQLPEEVIANLREVILNGDTDRLRELLHQVAARDEALAKSLLRLVDRYDYDALIHLLTRKDS